MNRRRLTALMLVVSLTIIAFAGCGKNSSQQEETVKQETEKKTGEVAKEEVKEQEKEEPYTVKIIAFGDATTEAANAVAEALSVKTRELYNIEIELVKGYTVEQLNLILTSGEKLDLFPVMPWEMQLSSLANNDQIIPIDDLLKEYAPKTLAAISESDWNCLKVGGKIYGVPMNKEKASNSGIIFRKDIVDEFNIDYESLTTLDKIEEVLMMIKEKTDKISKKA